MEASASGLTPVAPDVPTQPVAPSESAGVQTAAGSPSERPGAPAAPQPSIEQLQAQIVALQEAYEAANPTPPAKTDLVTRFKELAAAGVHIAERVRILADEGYAKNSTVEGVILELLDALIGKVAL
jgi:hypothetical protein